MNLRAIIVDDEPLAVRRLQIALARIGEIELVGTASDGAKAVDLIDACAPDLVLLDIMMPAMDGFELVRALDPAGAPEVIFVTAYSEFAVRAFEEGAVGYVLKPVGEGRLRVAVDRARVKLRTRNAEERLAALQSVLESLSGRDPSPESGFDQELWINNGRTTERILVKEATWFETAGDYVAVHCGSKELLLHDSLTSLAQRLDPAEFARVHRRAIVRLAAIKAVERGKFGALVLSLESGDQVRVSRSYKRSVLDRIQGGQGGLFKRY